METRRRVPSHHSYSHSKRQFSFPFFFFTFFWRKIKFQLPQIGETDSFVVDLELPFLLLYQDFVSPESVLVITGET